MGAIEFEARLKKWGRSFGVVVPMDEIRNAKLAENEKLEVIITKEKNPLKKHFGTHKFSRSTDEILKEGDEESWDE
jgi:ribosome maturation protein Sdo1